MFAHAENDMTVLYSETEALVVALKDAGSTSVQLRSWALAPGVEDHCEEACKPTRVGFALAHPCCCVCGLLQRGAVDITYGTQYMEIHSRGSGFLSSDCQGDKWRKF
jgi:hypothetical protein